MEGELMKPETVLRRINKILDSNGNLKDCTLKQKSAAITAAEKYDPKARCGDPKTGWVRIPGMLAVRVKIEGSIKKERMKGTVQKRKNKKRSKSKTVS